jgi:amidohydrolase
MINYNDVLDLELYVVEKRRDFHAHPETGFKEFRTSGIVIEELKKFGYDIKSGIGVTGIVATLKGNKPGKTVALRADMDALTMDEENLVPYKSQTKGVMHACGHDAHTAMLLGAAKFFAANKDLLNGTLKLVFQSAEEGPFPGGGSFIVDSGELDDVDAVFGIHITTSIEVGKLEIKPGPYMAAPDEYIIEILGKGTHASAPHTGHDPVVTAAQLILAFQNIVSRELKPTTPAVISTTIVEAGSAFNVIPDKVIIKGTLRTLTEDVRVFCVKRLEEMTKSITELNKSDYTFEFIEGYPALINDEAMTKVLANTARDVLGAENVTIVDDPIMGGEDFAYYLQRKPGAFAFIGGANKEKGLVYYNHSPKFDIDEDALLKGVLIHINNVYNFLNN